MHDKLHETAEKMLDALCSEIESVGLHSLDAEELGEVTDMVKDLCEAEYYARVSHAMGEDGKEGYRMGYDDWRYANGEFAPKGRGTYQGYTPAYDRTPMSNGRMGYPSPMEMDTYRQFEDRRRSYTMDKTADNKRMMEESAEKHLRDTMSNMREVLGEVDQPMRVKVKNDLVALINEL